MIPANVESVRNVAQFSDGVLYSATTTKIDVQFENLMSAMAFVNAATGNPYQWKVELGRSVSSLNELVVISVEKS